MGATLVFCGPRFGAVVGLSAGPHQVGGCRILPTASRRRVPLSCESVAFVTGHVTLRPRLEGRAPLLICSPAGICPAENPNLEVSAAVGGLPKPSPSAGFAWADWIGDLSSLSEVGRRELDFCRGRLYSVANLPIDLEPRIGRVHRLSEECRRSLLRVVLWCNFRQRLCALFWVASGPWFARRPGVVCMQRTNLASGKFRRQHRRGLATRAALGRCIWHRRRAVSRPGPEGRTTTRAPTGRASARQGGR